MMEFIRNVIIGAGGASPQLAPSLSVEEVLESGFGQR
jgi:hypothetical protein